MAGQFKTDSFAQLPVFLYEHVRDELCLEKIVAAAEDTMTYVINKHIKDTKSGLYLFYFSTCSFWSVRGCACLFLPNCNNKMEFSAYMYM